MADNSQSITLLSSESDMRAANTIEQQWKYPLTMISEKLTKKLYVIAIFNILMGIAIIGLEIGLLANDEIMLFTGIINGLYAIFVGILILFLCHGQVYILTSFFILVFFQLFFLLLALIAYCYLIITSHTIYQYPVISRNNRYHSNLIIKNFGLIILLLTLCTTIYTLIVIRNGRRPPPPLMLTAAYHAQQFMTMENI